jgi:hypothetical protein
MTCRADLAQDGGTTQDRSREADAMPSTSKESAPERRESGPAIDRVAHLDDYTINLTTISEDSSLAPLLRGLPDDACQCPHWGFMLAGEMTVNYTDGHQEVFTAGDAFYMPPGHVPSARGGSDFVIFSPKDELAVTEAAIAQNAAKMMAASAPVRES